MKDLHITVINQPSVNKTLRTLPLQGETRLSESKLLYLDIDDKYVHSLFPLLKDTDLEKPNYFHQQSEGAHISIAYPEEKQIFVDENEIGICHQFNIVKLAKARVHKKIYYFLMVESATLSDLRKKYGLTDRLNFKGYSVSFHITVGVKRL